MDEYKGILGCATANGSHALCCQSLCTASFVTLRMTSLIMWGLPKLTDCFGIYFRAYIESSNVTH